MPFIGPITGQVRHLVIASLFSIVALVLTGAGASADSAVLGPGDAISVSVYNRSDLSGAFTIPEDGNISLHLVGTVQAAGRTAVEIAEEIEVRLSESSNLPFSVLVTVQGRRPVYVLGDVQNPGAYAYAPTLNVQQALALAGGYFRGRLAESSSAETDAIRLEGEMRVLSTEIERFQAEQTRLLADLDAFADTGEGAPDKGEPLSGLDREILTATRSARAAQRDQIRNLQAVLQRQIEHQGEEIALRMAQIEQTRDQLDDLRALSERGLATNSQVNDLSSQLNELDAKRLELQIARLTAEQQLSMAVRDELQLLDDARANDLARLHVLEGEIATRQIRISAMRNMHAVAMAAGLVTTETDPEDAIRVTYRVTRMVNGTRTKIEVDPTALLQPGDTVEIERSAPD